MAKTSKATLEAIKKYNQKSKYIQLKYTQNAIKDYEQVIQYCADNNLSLQGYIKALIRADLDAKGFSVDMDSMDIPDSMDIADGQGTQD